MLVAGGAAQAQTVQPGLWESTSKVTAISAPDMPANVTAMMKNRPPIVSRQCIRPADAAKGFQEMFKDKAQNCVVKSNSYVGGVIDVQSQCTAQGRTSTMHMHGPYSPIAYTLTSEMTMNSADMRMKTSMIVSGRRIGPCS
jgi:hypothetical protein